MFELLPRSQAELEREWLRERFAGLGLLATIGRLRGLVPKARQSPAAGRAKARGGIVSRTG